MYDFLVAGTAILASKNSYLELFHKFLSLSLALRSLGEVLVGILQIRRRVDMFSNLYICYCLWLNFLTRI